MQANPRRDDIESIFNDPDLKTDEDRFRRMVSKECSMPLLLGSDDLSSEMRRGLYALKTGCSIEDAKKKGKNLVSDRLQSSIYVAWTIVNVARLASNIGFLSTGSAALGSAVLATSIANVIVAMLHNGVMVRQYLRTGELQLREEFKALSSLELALEFVNSGDPKGAKAWLEFMDACKKLPELSEDAAIDAIRYKASFYRDVCALLPSSLLSLGAQFAIVQGAPLAVSTAALGLQAIAFGAQSRFDWRQGIKSELIQVRRKLDRAGRAQLGLKDLSERREVQPDLMLRYGCRMVDAFLRGQERKQRPELVGSYSRGARAVAFGILGSGLGAAAVITQLWWMTSGHAQGASSGLNATAPQGLLQPAPDALLDAPSPAEIGKTVARLGMMISSALLAVSSCYNPVATCRMYSRGNNANLEKYSQRHAQRLLARHSLFRLVKMVHYRQEVHMCKPGQHFRNGKWDTHRDYVVKPWKNAYLGLEFIARGLWSAFKERKWGSLRAELEDLGMEQGSIEATIRAMSVQSSDTAAMNVLKTRVAATLGINLKPESPLAPTVILEIGLQSLDEFLSLSWAKGREDEDLIRGDVKKARKGLKKALKLASRDHSGPNAEAKVDLAAARILKQMKRAGLFNLREDEFSSAVHRLIGSRADEGYQLPEDETSRILVALADLLAQPVQPLQPTVRAGSSYDSTEVSDPSSGSSEAFEALNVTPKGVSIGSEEARARLAGLWSDDEDPISRDLLSDAEFEDRGSDSTEVSEDEDGSDSDSGRGMNPARHRPRHKDDVVGLIPPQVLNRQSDEASRRSRSDVSGRKSSDSKDEVIDLRKALEESSSVV